jgi:predicted enzyme related to lactoylglutathione lyase
MKAIATRADATLAFASFESELPRGSKASDIRLCHTFDFVILTPMENGMPRVIHFEIHADEPDRAIRFYNDLLGWEFTSWNGPFPYWTVVTGPDGTPGINGGLLKRQHPISGNDGVIAYVCTVNVDDLDKSFARGLELGGTVALPKMPIPGIGWLAYLKDTEGNVFGLMQADPSAK